MVLGELLPPLPPLLEEPHPAAAAASAMTATPVTVTVSLLRIRSSCALGPRGCGRGHAASRTLPKPAAELIEVHRGHEHEAHGHALPVLIDPDDDQALEQHRRDGKTDHGAEHRAPAAEQAGAAERHRG